MKFLSAFTLLTLFINLSTGMLHSYRTSNTYYYSDDFNDEENNVYRNFQDAVEGDFQYKFKASDESYEYPTIDKQSKYYKLGKELGKYVKYISKAIQERHESSVYTMRGELKSLEQTAELQKLNYKLNQKKDLISCAKLATFVAGLCTKLGIQDLRDLEGYASLKEEITLWAKVKAFPSNNFSQQLARFLSDPYQFPLLASLYQHALAL